MTVTIFLGSLLLAMAIGIPISYALLASGVALMWHLDLFEAQILAQNVINGADSFPLLAVPFFILSGEIMGKGGLSERLILEMHNLLISFENPEIAAVLLPN